MHKGKVVFENEISSGTFSFFEDEISSGILISHDIQRTVYLGELGRQGKPGQLDARV